MLTYKDRSWCSQQCGNITCSRNYTDAERAQNEWHVQLPVAQSNFRTDECGYQPVRKHTAACEEFWDRGLECRCIPQDIKDAIRSGANPEEIM